MSRQLNPTRCHAIKATTVTVYVGELLCLHEHAPCASNSVMKNNAARQNKNAQMFYLLLENRYSLHKSQRTQKGEVGFLLACRLWYRTSQQPAKARGKDKSMRDAQCRGAVGNFTCQQLCTTRESRRQNQNTTSRYSLLSRTSTRHNLVLSPPEISVTSDVGIW